MTREEISEAWREWHKESYEENERHQKKLEELRQRATELQTYREEFNYTGRI